MELAREEFLCPITGEYFEDPVSVPCCGKAFSRSALENWLRQRVTPTCASCRGDLSRFNIAEAPKNVVIAALMEKILPKSVDTLILANRWSASMSRIDRGFPVAELTISLENATFPIRRSLFIAVVDQSSSMEGNPWRQVKAALVHVAGLSENNAMVKTVIVKMS